MQSKPLGAYFYADDALAHLQAHADRLLRLQHALEEFAPGQLSRSCRIANFKAGIVVIHAANGATATKLKQLTPRFIDEFSRRGVDLTGIEVRLQVSGVAPAAASGPARTLSDCAHEAIDKLKAALPAESPVRDALGRFSRKP